MNEPTLFDAETMRRTEALTPAWADKIERLMEEAGWRPWYVTTDPRGPMIVTFGCDLETEEDIHVCCSGEAFSARADAELTVALVNAAHLIVGMVRRASTLGEAAPQEEGGSE